MADVNKELWTGEVEKKFRAQARFLNFIPDKSSLVGNSVIHLTELGADPEVLIDNTVYPIATAASNDNDVPIVLRKLDTTNTKVSDDELYAIAYQKIEEKANQHAETLIEKAGTLAAHSLSPQSDSANTPLLQTSGDLVDGRRRLTIADVLKLKAQFDRLKIPLKGRALVLSAEHVNDLLLINQTFQEQYSDIREGKILKLHGFDIDEYYESVYYNEATGQKKSFGSVPGVGDVISSFAFFAPKAVRAMGENSGQPILKMYYGAAENDPEGRTTKIGFRTRFICIPTVNKYFAAIMDKTA